MTRNPLSIALASHINEAKKVEDVSSALIRHVRMVSEPNDEIAEDQNTPQPSNTSDDLPPQDMLMRMLEMNAEDFEEINTHFKSLVTKDLTPAEIAANDIDKFIEQQSRFGGIPVEAALGNIIHLDMPNKFLKTMHIIGRAAAKEINKEKVLAAEGEVQDNNIDNEMTLKVLVDPESSRLVQRIFADYVSEDNLMRYAQFLIAFDKLLLKYRDGKPLERQEIDEANEVEEVRSKRKKKKNSKAKAKKVSDDRGDEAGNEPESEQNDDTDESMDEVEVASAIETLASNGDVAAAAKHLVEGYKKSAFFMMMFVGVMIRMADKSYRTTDTIKFFIQLFTYKGWEFYDIKDSNFLFKNKNGVTVALVTPFLNSNRGRKLTLISSIIKIGDNYKRKTLVELQTPTASRLMWYELDKIAPMTEAEYLAYVEAMPVDRDFVEWE